MGRSTPRPRLSKPAREPASYSEEYKEAQELWRNSGRNAAECESAPSCFIADALGAPIHVANSEPKSKRSVAAREAGIRRLRAEKAKLLQQLKP